MLTEAERLRRNETRKRNEAAKKERRERESVGGGGIMRPLHRTIITGLSMLCMSNI